MKTIKVTKMQGLGNDFVILDYAEYEKTSIPMDELAIKICDRNFGIGADGLMIPKLSIQDPSADIGWHFYNSDGTIPEMCGNGIRCFAKYVKDNKIVDKNDLKIETLAGIIKPSIQENGEVKVKMSSPVLEPSKIPFKGEKNLNYEITVLDKTFKVNAVSMGNPHCIIFINDNSDLLELAEKYGPELEKHPLFPEKTNVEFVRVVSKNEIDLRVYERGCGITLACGTGACAAVVAGILNNLTESKVKVNLLGGALTIEWQGSAENPNQNVFMTGPAEYSFFAEYIL